MSTPIDGTFGNPSLQRRKRKKKSANCAKKHHFSCVHEQNAHFAFRTALALTRLGRHDTRRAPFNYIRHALGELVRARSTRSSWTEMEAPCC